MMTQTTPTVSLLKKHRRALRAWALDMPLGILQDAAHLSERAYLKVYFTRYPPRADDAAQVVRAVMEDARDE